MAPIIQFHNTEYGTSSKLEDHTSYGLNDVWGIPVNDVIDRVFEFYNSKYFDEILPVTGSVSGVEYLSKKYDLMVITSRPTWLKDKTVEWLEKYYPNKFKKIVLTNQFSKKGKLIHKSQVCKEEGIETMIEDAVDYAMDCVKEGIKVYLYDMPWNREVDLPDEVVRLYNWKEIEKYL
jgi:uncharacterized HAD superfamily protein